MILLELINRWFEQKLCRHTEAVIVKYSDVGEYLPINRQYYKCMGCHKPLEALSYIDKKAA